MDQKQQLEELFDKWRRKSNHDATFIEDGIVNLPKWINQRPKVLFFLKEAYGGSFDFIAVMNIKKSHGQKQSDNADLEKFLAEDKAELAAELKIIDPDVILCGNTFHLLQSADIFTGMRKGKSDDYIWNGKLIINYWHPAGRGIVANNEVKYYAIREICRAAHYCFGITAW